MRVLGLLIATGGGVAIGFGWAGAAQVSCVDCQIPYLLSGGAAGIGLIIFGIALLLLAQIRTESRRLGDRIEHALGVRIRPEQAHRPAAPVLAEPVRRPAEAALASPEPAPNPLSAMPVDAPREPDTPGSDAATLAATTAAGGVVDMAEGDNGVRGDSSETGERSFHRSGEEGTPDRPSAGAAPEFLTENAPDRRRGFFRRRKGP